MSIRHLFIPLIAVLCLGDLIAHGQGPLTPGAAPSQSMKTLQQIQPAQPFPTENPAWPDLQSPPYVFTQPGRYFLTTSLEHATNAVSPVIIIHAPGVEIDLSGFSIYNHISPTNLFAPAVVHAIEVNIDGYNDPAPVVLRNGLIWGGMSPAIEARGVDLVLEDMIIDTQGGGVDTDKDLSTRRVTIYGNVGRAGVTDGWHAEECLVRGSAVSGSQTWTDVVIFPVIHRTPGVFYNGLLTGIAVEGPARWDRVIYAGLWGGSTPSDPSPGNFSLRFGPDSRFTHCIFDSLLFFRNLMLAGNASFENSVIREMVLRSFNAPTDSVKAQFTKCFVDSFVPSGSEPLSIAMDRTVWRDISVGSSSSRVPFHLHESNARVRSAHQGLYLAHADRSMVYFAAEGAEPDSLRYSTIRIQGKVNRSSLSADGLPGTTLDSYATLENSRVFGDRTAITVSNRVFASIVDNTIIGRRVGITLRYPDTPEMTVVRDNSVRSRGEGGTPRTLIDDGNASMIRGNVAFGAKFRVSNTDAIAGEVHDTPGEIPIGGMGNISTDDN